MPVIRFNPKNSELIRLPVEHYKNRVDYKELVDAIINGGRLHLYPNLYYRDGIKVVVAKLNNN